MIPAVRQNSLTELRNCRVYTSSFLHQHKSKSHRDSGQARLWKPLLIVSEVNFELKEARGLNS